MAINQMRSFLRRHNRAMQVACEYKHLTPNVLFGEYVTMKTRGCRADQWRVLKKQATESCVTDIES